MHVTADTNTQTFPFKQAILMHMKSHTQQFEQIREDTASLWARIFTYLKIQ